MSMFVDTSRVSVTDGENTIWVRRKMDFGTEQDVQSAGMRVAFDEGGKTRLAFDTGQYTKALMQFNIVGWSGPGFAGMKYSQEAVLLLDPGQPLVQQALAKINELNSPKKADDPNEPTPQKLGSAGEPSLTESATNGAALTTST